MFRVSVLAICATLAVYAAESSSRKGSRIGKGRDDPFFFPAYAVPPFGSPTAAQAPFTYGGIISGDQCQSECDATERYAIAEASRAVIAVETEIANSVLKTQTLEDNIVSLEAQLAQCFGAPSYAPEPGTYGIPTTGNTYGGPNTGGGSVYGASVEGAGYGGGNNNGGDRQYGFVPTYNTLPATYNPACSAILAQIGIAQNELCLAMSYIISLTVKSAALTGVRQALAYQCVGGGGNDYFSDYKRYGNKSSRRL